MESNERFAEQIEKYQSLMLQKDNDLLIKY
jgi:hypothetical protein